jgi:2-dehydro-3-deoxy-D-arabinonate dehydratase
MKLYKTTRGIILEQESIFYLPETEWDSLINRDRLYDHLKTLIKTLKPLDRATAETWIGQQLCAPVGRQEIWAAGVTYLRSRDARMDESKASGGADFYQKVYEAERPELFFKALPQRVSASGEPVFIRKDSKWNVPEPELTLYINKNGVIQGYTIGNDMSCRDIEGENPLYLPQAKVYERSAALGPCLYIPEAPIASDTRISIDIRRGGKNMFGDTILLNRMKRSLTELASYLFRECNFEDGCFLMTGTGMVPPPDFTLLPADEVDISIEGIGILSNRVELSTIQHK